MQISAIQIVNEHVHVHVHVHVVILSGSVLLMEAIICQHLLLASALVA
jgi:hypothetical protein